MLDLGRTLNLALAFIVASACYWLGESSANATTPEPTVNQNRLCLKANMTGLLDREIGSHATKEHWSLRGVEFRVETTSGALIRDWSWADPDDGCFLIPVPFNPTAYDITFRPYSQVLAGGNSLYVRAQDGTVPHYNVRVATAGSANTFDVEYSQDWELPRMYAVYAYAIQERFRAQFQNQTLTVWNDSAPGCTGNRYCGTIGGQVGRHINIAGDGNTRKFLMIHEYGHANIAGAGATTSSDCSLNIDGRDTTHHMRGIEHASCAAMEGWANYVAAVTFNGGPVSGGFMYWDGWDSVLDPGLGTGDCANPLTEVSWPMRYARTCANETALPARGTELDWMRFLWDYQFGTDVGPRPTNSQMQDLFIDAGSWGRDNVYSRVKSALPSSFVDRWEATASYNRICIHDGSNPNC